MKTKILMLTPKQIADALCVSVRTVYRRMADGTFPSGSGAPPSSSRSSPPPGAWVREKAPP